MPCQDSAQSLNLMLEMINMRYFLYGCWSIAGFCFLPSQPGDSSKDRGATVYRQFCQTCHQADGNGIPMANPSLARTTYVTGDKRKLIAWVLKGTGSKKVPIDGKSYANNMAPMAFLNDQQVADVLTFIRGSFGNQASPVALAEVKKLREAAK